MAWIWCNTCEAKWHMEAPAKKSQFEVIAQGHASPEAQVKYLTALLQVKQDKIATLELELKAMGLGLNNSWEYMGNADREIKGLKSEVRMLREWKCPTPWWKFWRKKDV